MYEFCKVNALNLEDLPEGPFDAEKAHSDEDIRTSIRDIALLPERLKLALEGLSTEQLGKPYREGGWMMKQVVHHLADGHMNGFIRMKLALTEDQPLIKPYDEKTWAETPDALDDDITTSLNIIESLHKRWHNLLSELEISDFDRQYRHPALGLLTLRTAVNLYAHHGNLHLRHIMLGKQRCDV